MNPFHQPSKLSCVAAALIALAGPLCEAQSINEETGLSAGSSARVAAEIARTYRIEAQAPADSDETDRTHSSEFTISTQGCSLSISGTNVLEGDSDVETIVLIENSVVYQECHQ